MRIGVDARSLLCREPRGEGKSLLRLYSEVVDLRPDYEIILFGDESAGEFRGPTPARTKIVPINWPGDRYGLWDEVYFPWAARWHGCSVLHCTSSSGPRWSPLPLLLTVHDLIPVRFHDGHNENVRRRFRRRLEWGVRRAGRVIAVSYNTLTDLESEFTGVTAKTTVIPWGCDFVSQPKLPTCRNDERPYLLAFGGEARRKNTTYTLERFAAVADRLPSLRLVIAGINSDAQRRRLLTIADRAGVVNRLEMLGYVSDEKLDTLMRHASALLYLSLYEGFGLPITEAIGYSVPVIASDCSSIPEILGSAPGCHALDRPDRIEQSIVEVVSEPRCRERWIRSQSEQCARLTWRACASRTIEQLDRAASAR